MTRAGTAVRRAAGWLAGAAVAYRRYLRLVIGTAVAIGVPAAVISLAADRLGQLRVDDVGSADTYVRLIVALVALTVGSIGGTVLAGALDGVMEDVAGEHLGRRERRSLARLLLALPYGRLIAADILVTALIAVGFVLLILPGVLLIALLALTGPLVTIEGVGPFRAARRSVALTRHALGTVALALLAPVLVVTALDGLVSQQGLPVWLRVGGTLAVAILAAPYSALVKVLATHRLRDLEERRAA